MRKSLLYMLVLLLVLCLPLAGCKKKQPVEEPPAVPVDALPEDDTLTPEAQLPEPVVLLVGEVLSDSVNVRQSPSTSTPSLGKVSRGELLMIMKKDTIEGVSGGAWYEVRYNGSAAYIHGDYLSVQEVAEDAVLARGTVTNVESVLNIRSQPNAQSQRVGRASRGQQFTVLSQDAGDGGWSKIEYDGGVEGVAYVKSEYLNVVEQMIANLLLP